MNIDIRKELGVIETPKNIFIKKQYADKHAAALRLAATENMFEQWHAEINRTNLRELPEDLIQSYEAAATQLCRILMKEKEIITDSNA